MVSNFLQIGPVSLANNFLTRYLRMSVISGSLLSRMHMQVVRTDQITTEANGWLAEVYIIKVKIYSTFSCKQGNFRAVKINF